MLLIDADSLIYFVAHLETVEEAILKLDERISNIFTANGSNEYVMFLTGKDCFRYKVAKSAPYKGNRVGRDKPKWLKVITQYMIAKYNAVYYAGLEADDCVTYFHNKIPNTRICAIDKDILLSTEGTHFNYGMKKIEGTEPQEWEFKGFITTTKLEADNGLYLQMMMGDSGDNIPGLKGIGEAKALRILGTIYSSEAFEIGQTEINEEILNIYVTTYGVSEGITKFAETFRLVYMLRTDEDCMREVGYIPELPTIQISVVKEHSHEDDDDSVNW